MENILYRKNKDAENKSFSFPPGFFEVKEIIETLKSISQKTVKLIL